MFEDLNKQQKEAVLAVEGPVCVIAGAGSGKTKALTSRIAHMIDKGISPSNILAITFTNKAAKEMKSRVASLLNDNEITKQLTISTFHSFCAKMLRYNLPYVKELEEGFTIMDEDESLAAMKTVFKKKNIDPKKLSLKGVLNFISTCKNNLIHWQESNTEVKIYVELYHSYQDYLKFYNRCDFDDLLLLTSDLLRNNPKVLECYQDLYKYILIDEYQDTNYAQYAIAHMLAKKNKNIFVVGDVDQAIYGFRGSNYRIILNFKKDYPQAKIIKLERNYRSVPMILEAANKVIENNTERIPKNLWTSEIKQTPIFYHKAATNFAEATWVLEQIQRELRNGYSYKDVCVLIRNNSLSFDIENTFVQHNIPYILVGAKKFYDRKEIKDVLSYLKILENPNDLISLKRIINNPRRNIGESSYTNLEEFFLMEDKNFIEVGELLKEDKVFISIPKKTKNSFIDFVSLIKKYKGEKINPLAKFVETFLKDMNYIQQYETDLNDDDKEENEMRLNNIYILLRTIKVFQEKFPSSSLGDFLEYVSLLSDADTIKQEEDKVTIMTCHASKGLEYPIVFLIAFEDGILPHWASVSEGNVEEERRVCYVAITRAKEKLYISNARKRISFGDAKRTYDSRFLYEIPDEVIFQV